MSKFGLFGTIIAKPGRRDELVQVLLEAAAGLEADPDCELYVVNVSGDKPDSVWVTEIWRDEAAHRASLELEETKALIQHAMPMIAGFGERFTFCPVGGKGI